MRQKQEAKPGGAGKTIRDIRRARRRCHSSEEKMLEGLRGEDPFAGLCRREGPNQNVYYRWETLPVQSRTERGGYSTYFICISFRAKASTRVSPFSG
jgi:transposase